MNQQMKTFLYLSLLLLFLACDDGDLQIETIDFDNATIQNCNPVDVATLNVLFKLNTTEALIVEVPAVAINNEVSEETSHSVSATGSAKVTYRTFSDNVSNDYFCSEIPLTEPTVSDEIIAESGELLVTTILNDDGITYEHKIELSKISFVTSKNQRITNLTIDNFGTVTTTVTTE